MVDYETYKELHPENPYAKAAFTFQKDTNLPTDDTDPVAPEVYLFPPSIPGFDLRRKKWS
jgi:hypothetical protein